MRYPARFEKEGDGYVVTFRDVPEAITQGDAFDEAVEMARHALASAAEFYRERRRPMPEASAAAEGEILIEVEGS